MNGIMAPHCIRARRTPIMGNGRPHFLVDDGQKSRPLPIMESARAPDSPPLRLVREISQEIARWPDGNLRFDQKKSGQRVASGARDARTGPQSGDAGLAIAERLAKADPANAQWQRDLSISRSNIDNVRREQAG